MSLYSMMKNNAKLALRGNWGKAILTMVILVGASMLLGVVQGVVHGIFVTPIDVEELIEAASSGMGDVVFQQMYESMPAEIAIWAIFALLGLLLSAPLSLGVTRWYFELVHSRTAPMGEIFRYFESAGSYVRSLWMHINLTVRSFLWAILFFALPYGMILAGVYFAVNEIESNQVMLAMLPVGVLLVGVLTLLALVFYIAFMNRYLLAAYLLCEDDNISVREAIRTSIAYTKGYKFSLFGYQLSFLGWYLLCWFLFPILYVYPYYNTSIAMYARYIIERGRFTPQGGTREFAIDGHGGENLPPQYAPPPPQYPGNMPPQYLGGMAQPPPQYPSETAPPPQYQSETAPPPQYQSETTPPPQYQSETAPPPQYQSETAPPPQYQSEMAPPPQYSSETAPPPQYQSETAPPPPQYPSETAPPPYDDDSPSDILPGDGSDKE